LLGSRWLNNQSSFLSNLGGWRSSMAEQWFCKLFWATFRNP
jgi:hypothetical protein